MSLRSSILTHSLPLLPTHSFTRLTLSTALASLPSGHPSHVSDAGLDSTLDTLFGPGPSGSAKALVERWEAEGLSCIRSFPARGGVRERLKKRLEYSSEVGEHLVEAYALLSTSGATRSLPIPHIPRSVLRSIPSMPRMYSPPSSHPRAPSPESDSPTSPRFAVPMLSSLLGQTGHRLPFLSVNPLGPLSYAWRISDAALVSIERGQAVRNGMMGEPLGSGPEWYTARTGVALAYLAAELYLLQPPAESAVGDPLLPMALDALDRNLEAYERINGTVEGAEQSVGAFMGYLGFVGRSAVGLIKSRGW